MINQRSPIAFSDPLPAKADAVVIGAGVVGTATAYQLAGRGLKVVLCDKGRVAGEQSSRNWGWIRQQGRDPAELPIMMESNRIWRGLAAETGEADLAFTPCGCVYLAEDPSRMEDFEHWHAVAREHQLDTRMLGAEEVRDLVPGVQGRWIGGMVTPSDGRAEPFLAVPALARAARRRGVVVRENCAVRTVESTNGAISAVHTEDGAIATARVLLAGGAWSSVFARNLGLDLPQLTVRSTAARTPPMDAEDLPNVSAPGFTLRRRADGGFTLSTGDVAEHYLTPSSFRYLGKFLTLLRVSARDIRIRPAPPAGYPGAWGSKRRWGPQERTPFEDMRVLDPPSSPIVRRRLLERLPRRAPWLSRDPIDDAIEEIWAGMIDVTPDAVPYLCRAPSPSGLFLGTGMSGHGFGIGPGAGAVLADLMAERAPAHDLTRFRFNRFSDGSPIVPGPY
jgi:glycine/D-amino acid oxidase-like deaminating enzyme